MVKVLLERSTLTAIGDALRQVGATSAKYRPAQMPGAIRALSFRPVAQAGEVEPLHAVASSALDISEFDFISSATIGG